MASSKWTESDLLKFIQTVEENDVVYNSKHIDHKKVDVIEDIWLEMDILFHKLRMNVVCTLGRNIYPMIIYF